MKTRENELHETKIYIEDSAIGYWAVAHCTKCNKYLGASFGTMQDIAINGIKKIIPCVCPNCCARLKEVE